MDSIKNYCPVCGYDLGFPSWMGAFPSDEICPCCGIQYGYDDGARGDTIVRQKIYDEWRQNWIKKGMPWYSTGIPQKSDWDPKKQLDNLN